MIALETIRAQGVVAIVRASSASDAAETVATLIVAGLRAIEVSLVTPGALDVIRDAARNAPAGVMIGVGTALTESDVDRAVDAGAQFVVSPIVNEAVIRASLAAGVTVLPGATTPTEAVHARELGATLIKLFPASLWSPSILREVLAALPDLQTVPTGGVQPDTAGDWIRAGAAAVGIGSALSQAADPAAATVRLLASIEAARATR
ncbi:bifunctional 4-hydroxy-2-oxoglutarate aldolase/2-dehydro-3-deoxy-phosphogluconate aldolase [Nakamurella antarctica]|uniref:Bifunctional 4-hydroxy-2-oxoglutarate aldolase/2-dehydro-3-deoxy-phosphogluconate aldolase n=1 Tax=Nakamurella antarctica TaxID=1902245 RepID=A0A3G8ZR73_9ACTN|nr:bifunctional 4-hydroxy-2-oxoglutarate aldolase/2-dehydro-3-deoxy-phosphogluconate aldolase [Nakamurella antarctica]AZI57054.1 bifunctional 4-hydroxy-2-oxoglutarate aldolase/2-dehydro-3-deoxy-phosphogluconate aldolase [Nakamurella antarctica]